TPSASKQEPEHHLYDDNTSKEINDEALDPSLQHETSHVELHPQHLELSDSIATPTADFPTVQLLIS
ncbi:hypothetical protein MKW92_048890, partial [Papaver armeniacum]